MQPTDTSCEKQTMTKTKMNEVDALALILPTDNRLRTRSYTTNNRLISTVDYKYK
jgi:hypothetical protein